MVEKLNWAEVLALKKAAVVLNALGKKLDYSAQQETKCLVEVCVKAAEYFDDLEKEQALSKRQD